MFIREIWGKFTSLIFLNLEISLVSLRRFQNFKKVNSGNLFQISLLNMPLLLQILYSYLIFIQKSLPFIMLKNGQAFIKNLALFTLQDFKIMFDHFSTL